MGLFWKKTIVIPEPNKSEVDWFFTSEAEERFKQSVRDNWDKMMEIWQT